MPSEIEKKEHAQVMNAQNIGLIPRSVTLATWMLLSVLAIGVLKLIAMFLESPAPDATTELALGFFMGQIFSLIVILPIYAFLAFLVFKIRHKRNWSRILYVTIFVLGLWCVIPLLLAELYPVSFVGIVDTLCVGLQGLAFVLLFSKEANAWFKSSQADK